MSKQQSIVQGETSSFQNQTHLLLLLPVHAQVPHLQRSAVGVALLLISALQGRPYQKQPTAASAGSAEAVHAIVVAAGRAAAAVNAVVVVAATALTLGANQPIAFETVVPSLDEAEPALRSPGSCRPCLTVPLFKNQKQTPDQLKECNADRWATITNLQEETSSIESAANGDRQTDGPFQTRKFRKRVNFPTTIFVHGVTCVRYLNHLA
jgi:hypothetical protein